MTKFNLNLILIFSFISLFAQTSSSTKPTWVDEDYPSSNKSYFEVIYVQGNSLEDARVKADEQLKKNRSLATGKGWLFYQTIFLHKTS